MKLKATLIAALFIPALAIAQAYDPSTGQRFDQYGRPLPSVEQLCREGQMAGGPLTEQCAMGGYRFNGKGQRLVRYDFTKWGYNLLDLVPEATAARLDADAKYRAAYIKSHHIQPYVKHVESDDDYVAFYTDGRKLTRRQLRDMCAQNHRDPMCRYEP